MNMHSMQIAAQKVNFFLKREIEKKFLCHLAQIFQTSNNILLQHQNVFLILQISKLIKS